MASITPRVFADVETVDGIYTICEGATVCGLVYTQNGITNMLDGKVRVINADTMNRTINQSCPPESYFGLIIDCPSIIIDSSSEYHADLHLVPIDSIVKISSVTGNGSGSSGMYDIPIVDDTDDIDPSDLRVNYTVLDRIE